MRPDALDVGWVGVIVGDEEVDIGEGDDRREARTVQLGRVREGDDASGTAGHHGADFGYQDMLGGDPLLDGEAITTEEHDVSRELAQVRQRSGTREGLIVRQEQAPEANEVGLWPRPKLLDHR